MPLAVLLKIKAERQLIPVADRYLSQPSVIPQQVTPARLRSLPLDRREFQSKHALPISQLLYVSIPAKHPDTATQVNFSQSRQSKMLANALDGAGAGRVGASDLLT